MNLEEKAKKVNSLLKAQKSAISFAMKSAIMNMVKEADGSLEQGRDVACSIAPYSSFIEDREWSEGMITNPGDIVFDPEKNYRYIFTGTSTMTHSNPSFYPGSSGVYYWAIIPKIKDECKIYPNIEGIIVSVKHNELWWDTNEEHIYRWVGQDNQNCFWPPQESNEWELIE